MKNVVLLLTFFCVSLFARGQESDLQLITTAGGNFTNQNLQVSWSLGELNVASYEMANLMVSQGFHQSISTTTSTVTFGSDIINIKTFPNPAHTLLTIEADAVLPETIYFEIRNLLGQLVKSGPLRGRRNTVDVSTLTPQLYLLSFLTQSNERISTIKIQKIN